MYIYSAAREKVNLKLVKADFALYEDEPLLRVAMGQREYASRLSERVTRAALSHFKMPSQSGAVRRAAAVPLDNSPAVFEESTTGLTRVVYKEIVLRFGAKVSERRRKQILNKHGLKIRRVNSIVPNQVIAYDAIGTHVGVGMLDIANDCAEMDEIVFSTPNFISQYRRDRVAPNIPALQWHLYNRGTVQGQMKGEDVDAREAWKITQGRNRVTVAVLDDGVDIDHPNLKSGIRKNPDPNEPRDKYGRDFYIPADHPDHFNPRPKVFQFPYDRMRGNDIHGTPCAGVIAARGKDGVAFGIAPRCRILPVKIFHADDLASDAQVADAIRYAALHADVLSCSWSGPASPDIELAIEDAGQIGRDGGAAVFCASGNGFRNQVSYPAAFDAAIAVGASTDMGERAAYSQYGPELWIVAPSSGGLQDIFTTDVSNENRGFNIGSEAAGGLDGLHTNSFGGTSSATPLAAGIAALVLSVKPTLEREQVKQILADTADKIGNGYDPQTGKSLEYGYGRVNAAKAVEAAKGL